VKPHKIAWRSIQPTLFGDVCEITSRPDWGFKQDRKDIQNVTAEEFLDSPFFSDTIILHILAGEGVSLAVIQDLIPVVYDNCVKLVILEHNPISSDWTGNEAVSVARLQFLLDTLRVYGDSVLTKDLGRNLLFTLTTLHPLDLPELSDSFYEEKIDMKYKKHGQGIDNRTRVYTHTSELPLPDEYLPMIPEDLRCTWVIGGQWYLDTIPKLPNNEHHLIDTVLLQLIYARYVIEDDREDPVFLRKIGRLYNVVEFKRMAEDTPDLHYHGDWAWRNVIKDRERYRGIKDQISSIRLGNVADLHPEGELVYTSTVKHTLTEHLLRDNYVISAALPGHPRNHPALRVPEETQSG
jgi:hypothetical protein